MRRAWIALLVVLPAVALFGWGLQHDPNAHASPLVGKPAPAFTLRSLDGKRVTLQSLRGRPVVLNFWASWCASCKAEHGYLLDAERTYSPLGVAVVGVLYQDTAGDARAFLRQYGADWPSLADPDGTTAVRYGVGMVPETYFIDRRGVVRYKEPGPVWPALLNQQIQKLLGDGV
jgi:cytochrome c biogenesis protein CcmG/thiol:disulfide interchange protein DsbE